MSAPDRTPGGRAGASALPRSLRLPPAIVAMSPGDLQHAPRAGEPSSRAALGAGARALLAALEGAVAGGVSGFVLREPALGDGAFLALAREARAALGEGWLAIHDRVHLADACGADAVHVGFRSLAPSAARAISAAHVAVGFSAHAHDVDPAALRAQHAFPQGASGFDPHPESRSESNEALARAGNPDVRSERESGSHAARSSFAEVLAGADYVFAGPVRAVEKAVEVPPLGFDGLEWLARAAARPTWAIGGLASGDLARVRAAGARGAVVRRGILGASDPRAAAAAYLEAWERAT